MKVKRPIYLLSPSAREGVRSFPMIEFEKVAATIDFSHCDTLMFTSKQAVVTADSIDPVWRKIPSIAIGSATKREIERWGGSVIYQPKHFYGKQLAKDIESFFRDRHILYLRPETVSFDSRGYLQKYSIELQEQIIYKTTCIRYTANEQPPDSSIIIFTSPSTIHCFLENFDWYPGYTAVVIGEATREHLPKGCDYAVADTPLIDACVEKALQLQYTL